MSKQKWSKARREARRASQANQGQLFSEQPKVRSQVESKPGETPAAAGPERSGLSEHRTDAAGGGPLFQSYGSCCDKNVVDDFPANGGRIYGAEDLGQVIGKAYLVYPCRCRSTFCRTCGPRQGYETKKELIKCLKKQRGIYGVTLTLDPKLFQDQEQGWSYVMENRLLSRFARELVRRKVLHSKAYFWSVEFQEHTEQAHWHLLFDATEIDHGILVEIWSRFRPPWAPPLDEPITAKNYKGRAPGLGSVWFTANTSLEKAAYYATKYLTKYPENGYPDWLLDRVGKFQRYGHSQKFFPKESGHDPMCFCDECRGDAEVPPKPKRPKLPKPADREPRPKFASTPRQRAERCGNTCSLLEVQRVLLPDGTIVDGRGRFVAKLNLPFYEACEFVGEDPEKTFQLRLDGPTATALEENAAERGKSGEAA